MTKHGTWLASIALSFAAAACTATATTVPPPSGPVQPAPPPPGPAPAGPPMAADNGQPKMHATLKALEAAHKELSRASPNKGGHRERGLELISQAMAEVNAGIEFANAHAHEVGPAEPPAPPEPVSGEVAGSERQPNMRNAMISLREARKQLIEAEGDKGGHRVKALGLIDQAMKQVHEGIEFALRK